MKNKIKKLLFAMLIMSLSASAQKKKSIDPISVRFPGLFDSLSVLYASDITYSDYFFINDLKELSTPSITLAIGKYEVSGNVPLNKKIVLTVDTFQLTIFYHGHIVIDSSKCSLDPYTNYFNFR